MCGAPPPSTVSALRSPHCISGAEAVTRCGKELLPSRGDSGRCSAPKLQGAGTRKLVGADAVEWGGADALNYTDCRDTMATPRDDPGRRATGLEADQRLMNDQRPRNQDNTRFLLMLSLKSRKSGGSDRTARPWWVSYNGNNPPPSPSRSHAGHFPGTVLGGVLAGPPDPLLAGRRGARLPDDTTSRA